MPDFVGTSAHIAIEHAADNRILLTGDDLGGASLHARTWPGPYGVTAQDVSPGTVVVCWSRVVVTYAVAGGTRSGAGTTPVDPPPALSQHAGRQSVESDWTSF